MLNFDVVMSSSEGLQAWTQLIARYGFCFVDSCPVEPQATEALINRLAYVRHTHYGGFYDFTSDLALKDTAYTTEALDVHTDTTYFTDPAGLQMLHLLSHTGGEGGQSVLVDGFEAARRLKTQDAEALDVLKSVKIPWHASGNEGISISPTAGNFPVIQEISPASLGEQHSLLQVRWNNSDRGSMVPFEGVERWYQAASKFQHTLQSPGLQYRFQLQPGKPLSRTLQPPPPEMKG